LNVAGRGVHFALTDIDERRLLDYERAARFERPVIFTADQ
jgi:hypothetical protein